MKTTVMLLIKVLKFDNNRFDIFLYVYISNHYAATNSLETTLLCLNKDRTPCNQLEC